MKKTIPLDPAACRDLVASKRWLDKAITDPATGCVEWTGAISSDGYGKVKLCGHMARAHRVALVASRGRDLHPELVVDHLCRIRACVNPEHLREVTHRENLLAPGALTRQARTHCPSGHPLEGDNLLPSQLARGWRACATCNRAQSAAVSAAHHALGVTHRQYVAHFGAGRTVALTVLDEVVNPCLFRPDGSEALLLVGGPCGWHP